MGPWVLINARWYEISGFFDCSSDGLFELSGVGAVNASAHLGGQYTVLPFGRDILRLRLPNPCWCCSYVVLARTIHDTL